MAEADALEQNVLKATSSESGSSPEPTKTPCWECSRRGWTCDGSLPVCNRCKAAGIVCPGYGNSKPLVWLAPGRVTSRTRRQRPGPKGKTPVKGSAESKAKVKKEDTDSASKPSQKSTPAVKESRKMEKLSLFKPGDDISKPYSILSLDRNLLSAVIQQQLSPPIHPPLIGTKLTELNKEWCQIIEVAQYYNTSIYPELTSNQLAPSPFDSPFITGKQHIQSTHHALISLVLHHQMVKISKSPAKALDPNTARPSSGPTAALWLRLHHHTGIAIRALKEEISKEETRMSDETIMSVILIILVELHQSVIPKWKPHMDGLMALIMLRGGLEKLLQSASPTMIPVMLIFTIVSVIGNTTSPANCQLAAPVHFKMVEMIEKLYSKALYPQLPCPSQLFLDIVRINHLRFQMATDSSVFGREWAEPTTTGTILSHVAGFHPEEWVKETGLDQRPESLPVAKIFRAAVSLYAMNALPWPSNSPPPSPPEVRREYPTKAEYRAEIFELLEDSIESPVIKRCIIWPLIVAGVEAAQGTAAERKFIGDCLADISDQAGAPSLSALRVLKRFWESGEVEWDLCFPEPCLILG